MTSSIGIYTPWYPLKDTPERYEILDFSHTLKGVKIKLSKYESEKKTDLYITFPRNSTISRIMNETYRIKLYETLPEIFKNLPYTGPLFKVEGSDFMKSLANESYDIMNILDFKHYLITDYEWIIDVASQDQPEIDLFIDDILIEKLESIHHAILKKRQKHAG